jgi:hypothetical protein
LLGQARTEPSRTLVDIVRIAALVLFAVQLVVIIHQVRPDLVNPTDIGTDTSNYFAAGQRLNAGHPLYALSPGDRPVPFSPPFTTVPLLSPPLLGVIWRPLALLGDVSMEAWRLAGLVSMVVLTMWLILRGSPIRNTLLVLLFPALAMNAWSGNINAFLDVALVGVALAARGGQSRTAGALVAVAAAVKLTPALLIVWFLVRRDWQAVRAFLVTGAALAVVSLVGAGLDNHLAYLQVARDSATVGPTDLSIPGILRNTGAPSALVTASTLLVMAAGIVAVYLLRRRPGAAFIAAIFMVLYSSPVVMLGNYGVLIAALIPFDQPTRAAIGESIRRRWPGPAPVSPTAAQDRALSAGTPPSSGS